MRDTDNQQQITCLAHVSQEQSRHCLNSYWQLAPAHCRLTHLQGPCHLRSHKEDYCQAVVSCSTHASADPLSLYKDPTWSHRPASAQSLAWADHSDQATCLTHAVCSAVAHAGANALPHMRRQSARLLVVAVSPHDSTSSIDTQGQQAARQWQSQAFTKPGRSCLHAQLPCLQPRTRAFVFTRCSVVCVIILCLCSQPHRAQLLCSTWHVLNMTSLTPPCPFITTRPTQHSTSYTESIKTRKQVANQTLPFMLELHTSLSG